MSWTDNVGSPDITNPGCLMAAPVVPVAQDDNSLKIWYIHAYLRNRIALTNVLGKQWTAYPSSYDKLTFNTSTNSFSFVPTLPDIKAGIPTDEQGFYELFNKDFKKLNNPDYLKSIKQLCGYNELGGYRNYKC